MSEDIKTGSTSGQVGSPNDNLISTGPSGNLGAAGGEPGTKTTPIDLSQYVPKSQYEELEKKYGSQGMEVGELRTFLKDVEPLFDVLKEQPDLTEAIVEGKFTPDLVDAIVNNKVKIEDATIVAKAHDDVKKELGKPAYTGATKEEIEALVNQKLAEIETRTKAVETKLTQDISSIEEKRQFEQSVDEFIKSTPDFPDYAEEISQWFADHTDQYDIEIAYHAVKGRKAASETQKQNAVEAAEAAKNAALNASGGASQSTQVIQNQELVDKLIGRTSNPNIL